MWFNGSVDVPRETLFKLKSVKKNATWQPKQSGYDSTLKINPYAFAYAAMRTSIVGTHLGLRGSLAGSGLALAAAAYLITNGPKLSFHSRFNNVKDFIGTGIKGTVGAAFSYLYMLDKGYIWAGHWEDTVATPFSGPHPDFVFASKSDVCLIDAKGSSSPTMTIEKLVKSEWKRQILPHEYTAFTFGGTSTEGAVIATEVSSSISANFIKTHGKFKNTSVSSSTHKAIKSVQQANYINACFLLGLHQTAFSMLNPKRANSAPLLTLERELKASASVGDDMFYGPPRLILPAGRFSYLSRPFVRVDILRSILKTLSSNDDFSNAYLPNSVLQANEPGPDDEIIVQGPDGVGAEFTVFE